MSKPKPKPMAGSRRAQPKPPVIAADQPAEHHVSSPADDDPIEPAREFDPQLDVLDVLTYPQPSDVLDQLDPELSTEDAAHAAAVALGIAAEAPAPIAAPAADDEG